MVVISLIVDMRAVIWLMVMVVSVTVVVLSVV